MAITAARGLTILGDLKAGNPAKRFSGEIVLGWLTRKKEDIPWVFTLNQPIPDKKKKRISRFWLLKLIFWHKPINGSSLLGMWGAYLLLSLLFPLSLFLSWSLLLMLSLSIMMSLSLSSLLILSLFTNP